MKEASLVKFYFARYFFLAFGLLQGLAATMLVLQFQDTPKNRFAAFVFFTLAMILFSIHFLNICSLKIKGKKRIYFLPAHDSEALFGLFSAEPEFFAKKVS